MLHPLLQLAASRPQLLADHAGAWADLLAAECGPATAAWQRRWLLQALAVAFAVIGLTLSGVALMLWAVLPAAPLHSPWVALALILTPAWPLGAAAGCLLAARVRGDGGAWQRLGRQLQADLALLRQTGAA